jgi:L-threonylcarbamoyladenylate synthase
VSDDAVNLLPANGPNAIEWTVDRLLEGGVIVFPTDTVYGLAASLHRPDQLDRIYRIKGRDEQKPLPILVASSEDALNWTIGLSEEQALLLDQYWPGPLTLVVPAGPNVPKHARAVDGTVGLRSPNHPLALEIIARCGGAIACTSANRSGGPAAVTAQEAAAALGSDVDVILDGGATPGGVSSTVVGFDGDELRLFREGPIALEHLQAAWRELRSGRS